MLTVIKIIALSFLVVVSITYIIEAIEYFLDGK